MAAILGLDDEKVEQVCAQIDDVVVAANYNCPGQLVISGTLKGIEMACVKLKEAGAKRALPLPVGGAFHSPLMEPAREQLAKAIETTTFSSPRCPIYQNVNALPSTDVQTIKTNLIAQLTQPVRWTQSVQRMVKDGASIFIECGPGKVLQGLVKKISPGAEVGSIR
jgi:[acyl-carrier-protein] S-malonyltransferase